MNAPRPTRHAITKAMSGAVLVALGLALTTWAAEPPKPEQAPEERFVVESARDLPVADEVDIVVVNGNFAGIAAAVEAAQAGCSVLLLHGKAGMDYDLAETYRLWLDADEVVPQAGLAQRIFGDRPSDGRRFIDPPSDGRRFIVPGRLKWRLEQLLVESKVKFFYWTQAVGLLVDEGGQPAGVVMANKAGRQAVKAKVVLDCTPMGALARMAGAATFARGGPAVRVSRMILFKGAVNGGEKILVTAEGSELREFAVETPAFKGTWLERCAAENLLRRTFGGAPDSPWQSSNVSWVAHTMHAIEPHGIVGETRSDAAALDAERIDLGCFRPKGIVGMLIGGPAASVSLPEAQRLTRPFDLLAVGHRLGAEAVRMAKSRTLGAVKPLVRVPKGQGVDRCDVAEDLKGHRPHHEYPRLRTEANAIPVWGEYDVVVVGGGTAGFPAAEAAAKKGAKVLVVEMLGVLGGTSANGIGGPVRGEIAHDQLTKAGCEIWLNTMACGVVKAGQQVSGVVVGTPIGRGAVLAKITIDATGDGDLGAWAGAPVMFVNDGDMAVQNTALLSSREKTTGQNDWNGLPFDPSDLENLTSFHVIRRNQKETSKDRPKEGFDYWPLLGIRETRRILGDNFVTLLDQAVRKTYQDPNIGGGAGIDVHGFEDGDEVYMGIYGGGGGYPLGSVIPKGLDGLLMAGKAVSTSRMVMGGSRFIGNLRGQGARVGAVAAAAALQDKPLREIDERAVSGRGGGNLKPWQPPGEEDVAKAVKNLEIERNRAIVAYSPEISGPLLKKEFAANPTFDAALVLCILLREKAGAPLLIEWLDKQTLQKGLPYTGPLQEFFHVRQKRPDLMTQVKIAQAVWALGRSGDRQAVPTLARMLESCPHENDYFSHLRALTFALGWLGGPEAAEALAKFLDRPGVSGHVKRPDDKDAFEKWQATVELFAASGLYRAGDVQDKGRKILEAYHDDWRGVYVRFAHHVLNEKKP